MDDAGTFDGVASIDDASIAFDDDRRLGATDATTRTTDATTRPVEGTTAVGTTTTNATMVESRGDARTDDEDDANVTLEMYLSGDVVLAATEELLARRDAVSAQGEEASLLDVGKYIFTGQLAIGDEGDAFEYTSSCSLDGCVIEELEPEVAVTAE